MRQSAAMLRLAERAPTRSGMEHKVEKHGGERGIRTPGTLAGTSDFESDAIDQLCHLSKMGQIVTHIQSLAEVRSERKNAVSISPHSLASTSDRTSIR